MSGQHHAPEGAPSRAGARVAGRYRLDHEIGRGGMGVVWYAVDEVLDRPVAVKQVTIPPSVAHREAEILRERVLREARAAGRVQHDAAVTVYDVVDEDGTPYLVMELLEARSLAQIIRDDGPLSPREAARVGLEVLGALEAAHAAGVIHRDVKPGNVLIADDGRVMLTDFGIASSQGDATITATGLLLGSPAYIPPERARGTAGGPSSDIWSLAATLWTAVEGRPAYDGDGPVAILTAVVERRRHDPVRAGELGPVLIEVLDADAASRPDAATFRAALETVARTASDEVPDVTPVTASPRNREQTQVLSAVGPAAPRRSARRRPSPSVRRRRLGLGVVLLAGAVAGVVGWQLGTDGSAAVPLTTYRSAAGWSIGVPSGWQPYVYGDKSWKRPGDAVVYVQVERNRPQDAKASLVQTLATQRASVAGFSVLSGPSGSGTEAAAEWQQRGSDGSVLRVRDVHVVQGDHMYALLFGAPTDDWSRYQATFAAVRSSFRAT